MNSDSISHNPVGSFFINFFLVKKTFAILLTLVILFSGYLGYQSIIKEALPDLEIPNATIHTYWHGASQTIMEKEVTNKIEQEIRDLKGLKDYSSGSMFSNSIISAEFEADAPMQESLNQLRQRVAIASDSFHDQIKKPKIEQVAIRNMPIISYVLHGNLDGIVLENAAKQLEKKLQKIQGICKVMVYGNRKPYVSIQLLPDRLRSFNITPTIVHAKLKEHELDFPLGVYESRELPFNLKSQTAFTDLNSIRDLPITRIPNGRVIRLKEIANVENKLYREEMIASFSNQGKDYQKGIALSVLKMPGKDTIQLVSLLNKEIERAKAGSDWPEGMEIEIVADNAQIIREELNTTFTNGWQAVLIVFAVLFILLTWREAVIAALCIPITLLGTISILYLMGYTLNVMTIVGMILALGLLVDDFILMMEGMHDGIFIRRFSFMQAAWHTVKTYGMPSFSGSLTTIMVFVPLALISGLDGKFIRIIPVTAAICLILSYLVSIIIAIPISQIFLKNSSLLNKELWIDKVSHRIESVLVNWLSKHAVKNRFQSVKLFGIGLTLFLLSLGIAIFIPVILYPLTDGRDLGITIELPADFKLEESHKIAQRVGDSLREKPYISSILRITGERDFMYEGRLSLSSAPYIIGFTCKLKPKGDRDRLGYEYVNELRKDIRQVLHDIPGYQLMITPETGGSSNEDPIQINLSGPDMNVLRRLSREFQKELLTLDGIEGVHDNLGQLRAEAMLIPKRELLNYYGISEAEFNSQLSFYLGDTKAIKLRSASLDDDLEIRLETYWHSQNGKTGGPAQLEELQRISIMNDKGLWIPFSSLVEQSLNHEAMIITHKNGVRNLTVMAKTYVLSIEESYQLINPILERLKQSWPKGYEYQFGGEKELADETFGNTKKAFLFSVIIVFCILALQFDSFRQPVIILFSALFAIMGVILGSTMFAFSFSFPMFIGVISLIGIVVNDAIVMVDTMNRHRDSGLSISQAAAHGASDRLRPIVSTTVTTILGLAPLAISSEEWRPLCMAIVFGESVSTFTTIFLIPCLYHIVTPSYSPSRNEEVVRVREPRMS